MKYNKGDKLMIDGHETYYIDEFFSDDENKNILVCGNVAGFTDYVPEDEAVFVQASNEEKVLNVLVDIAATMKSLVQSMDEMKDMLCGGTCDCDECNSGKEKEEDNLGNN